MTKYATEYIKQYSHEIANATTEIVGTKYDGSTDTFTYIVKYPNNVDVRTLRGYEK